jgi:hypothetical protein
MALLTEFGGKGDFFFTSNGSPGINQFFFSSVAVFIALDQKKPSVWMARSKNKKKKTTKICNKNIGCSHSVNGGCPPQCPSV